LYNDKIIYNNACEVSREYVKSNIGATKIILNYIDEKIKNYWQI
jgi:hypothetical protein